MAITLDTTLGTLLDDPQAKAVLEQYLPGISSNPLVAMGKGMSLRMILSLPVAAQFGLTEEKVNEILAEIKQKTCKRICPRVVLFHLCPFDPRLWCLPPEPGRQALSAGEPLAA